MVTIEDLKNPYILTQKLSEIGVSEELISHPAFYNIHNIITDVITHHLDKKSLGNMIFEQEGVLAYKAFTAPLVPIEFIIEKKDMKNFYIPYVLMTLLSNMKHH